MMADGYPLRQCEERIADGVFGHVDLVAVLGERAGIRQRGGARVGGQRLAERLAAQQVLGLLGAPGLRGDAAEHDADVGERAVAYAPRGGDGYEAVVPRAALADLRVAARRAQPARR